MTSTIRSLAVCVATLAAVFLGTGVSQAQQTYTIASFLDYSGAFASRGKPVEQMQRLLIDWFNDTRAAKVGIKLDYKPYDTGYDPAKSVQAYERAIEDKSVIGSVLFGSPIVIGLQSRLGDDKIPGVNGGPSLGLMKPGNWVFAPLGDYVRYFAAAAKWRLSTWKESRPLKIAFVTFDGSSGRDWATGLAPGIKGLNAEIAVTEYISPRATTVAANVDRVVAADVDLVFLAGTDQLQPMLLKELKARNFDMTKVINSQHEGLSLLEMLGVPKDVYEGSYEVTSENYVDTNTPAYKIYKERESKYQTRWAADTLLHFPSVMVLLDAIERAASKAAGKKISGQDVYNELSSGTFDGYGLLGKIKFNIAVDPTQGVESVVMLQQKGGKIVTASEPLPLAK